MLGVVSVRRRDCLRRQQSWNSAYSYSVYDPEGIFRSWRAEEKSCQNYLRPEENDIRENSRFLVCLVFDQSVSSNWSVDHCAPFTFLSYFPLSSSRQRGERKRQQALGSKGLLQADVLRLRPAPWSYTGRTLLRSGSLTGPLIEAAWDLEGCQCSQDWAGLLLKCTVCFMSLQKYLKIDCNSQCSYCWRATSQILDEKGVCISG